MKYKSASIAFALLLASALCAAGTAHAGVYREDIALPMPQASPAGLQTLLLRPDEPGRFPLVLMSHGAPRNTAIRAEMSPERLEPQALEFVRRGFAVAIVMRRGYGHSGGDFAEDYGLCTDPDYLKAGRNSAVDLKFAISELARRPDIDATRMIAVGQSAGGFASVALTAEAPPGLIAAISFAGGRGSQREDELCGEDRLVAAFGAFGQTSRLPMLWVYTENDHYFPPAVADRLRAAFVAGGGKLDFVRLPAFGRDGHSLFSRGVPQWTPIVDAFLKKQNLVLRRGLLPAD